MGEQNSLLKGFFAFAGWNGNKKDYPRLLALTHARARSNTRMGQRACMRAGSCVGVRLTGDALTKML